MPPKFLKLYLSALKPHAALNVCKALRHFMAYAVSVELVEEDPTRGIKLKTPATDGFHSWDDNEIAAYRAKYPLGTQERLAAEIAANLGLRCGDVAKVGRQHMQAEPDPQGRWQNVIVYRATKTRKSRSADALRVPVLPDLQEALDAMPVSPHLTFLTDEG
jgi:hypothetical protein